MLTGAVATILSIALPGAAAQRDRDELIASPVDSAASTNGQAWLLILVGAALRILSYIFSRNVGGDALERAALTARWVQHPEFKMIFGGVYPPGHFWLMGPLALLIPDVTLAVRLLSLVLGVGSLFLVWKLACVLYGRDAAIMSLAVFTLYSLHVGYSATSSSEVPCVFFILLALWFFFSYFYRGAEHLGYLASSGMALSIAGSIRYEPWLVFGTLLVVMPLLWMSHPARRERMKALIAPVVVFASLGGAWPALSMAYFWTKFGDPMYLVAAAHSRMGHVMATSAKPVGYYLALIPSVLFISLSPIAFGAAVYGIATSRRRRPLAAAFAAVTVFFLTVQMYQILHGGFLSVARYSLIPGAMLAVISGDGLQQICQRILPGRVKIAHAAVIVFLLINLSAIFALSELPSSVADKFASISPRLRPVTRIGEVGAYLRAHMREQDALVVDDFNVESDSIANAAGLPILAGRRAYLMSVKNDMTVSEYINREHPRFLVYSDQGALRNTLTLPSDCSHSTNVGGIEFHCGYSDPIYRVYELSYH